MIFKFYSLNGNEEKSFPATKDKKTQCQYVTKIMQRSSKVRRAHLTRCGDGREWRYGCGSRMTKAWGSRAWRKQCELEKGSREQQMTEASAFRMLLLFVCHMDPPHSSWSLITLSFTSHDKRCGDGWERQGLWKGILIVNVKDLSSTTTMCAVYALDIFFYFLLLGNLSLAMKKGNPNPTVLSIKDWFLMGKSDSR